MRDLIKFHQLCNTTLVFGLVTWSPLALAGSSFTENIFGGIIVLGVVVFFLYVYIVEPISNRLARKREQEAKENADRAFADQIGKVFGKGFLNGRKWLADFIADANRTRDEALVRALKVKRQPALKAAEEVKAAKDERRDALRKLKLLEYELATIKEYFPFVHEFEELILEDELRGQTVIELGELNDSVDKVEDDRARWLLTKEEYEKLQPAVRYQRALDNYLAKNHSPVVIGRMYERFIGYKYEANGWNVTFQGAIKGLEDMGRDLICKKGKTTEIVQAKCWSRDKVIHEKHIFQLCGTVLLYELTEASRGESVTAVFCTTTKLSDVAKMAAHRLSIDVRLESLNKAYPMIKCNIGMEGKIYHLPFDQQYDRVKLVNKGECYTQSVAEAEAKGFRRAKRYLGAST